MSESLQHQFGCKMAIADIVYLLVLTAIFLFFGILRQSVDTTNGMVRLKQIPKTQKIEGGGLNQCF